jgi:Signal transduction histidine kinase
MFEGEPHEHVDNISQTTGTPNFVCEIGTNRFLSGTTWLVLLMLFMVNNKVCPAATQPQVTPFQNAAAILALSEDQADRHDPATIRGIVTGVTDYGLFIQDKTAGIWAEWKGTHNFVPGDVVEVNGRTGPGLFSPVVEPSSIVKVGHSTLPKPKRITLKQLLTGNEDSQYVEVEGTIRSVWIRPEVAPAQRVWLNLALDGRTIRATLPSKDATAANKLIGARIRFTGNAACSKNLNRQFTSVLLTASSIKNVTVIKQPPEDLFSVPRLPIARLLQYRSENDPDERVKVSGIVTYNRPGDYLIVEENNRALLVKSYQSNRVTLGDRIEVAGFPTPAPSGPFLDDAVIRLVGRGEMPQPASVSITDLSSGKLNYTFVTIEGKLLQRVYEPSREVLLIDVEKTLLRAELDNSTTPDLLKRVREGSTVKITGISLLSVEGSWNQGGPAASVVHYTVLLRSPDDVIEVKAPSWWTATHLIVLAAILGILMFLFFALALYGRMEQLRLEAVMNERERLAHEIHDTLAQSFAGIGFQLQAIRRAIPKELSDLLKQIDLARSLVKHSHKEAHRSIEPLNVSALQKIDLLCALESATKRMLEGGEIEVLTETIDATGKSQSIPPKIAYTMVQIGQEAIANAVRHADPSHITIALTYEEQRIILSIRDNGRGFVERGDLLGFGLRGMRKRVASISANLRIMSEPGHGTNVEVTCPLPPVPFISFLKLRCIFLSEHKTHVE